MNLIDFQAANITQLQAVLAIERACHLVPWASFDTLKPPQYWGKILLNQSKSQSKPQSKIQNQTQLQAATNQTDVLGGVSDLNSVDGYIVFMVVENEWELLNLSIKPAKQGAGLGLALLQCSLLMAKQAGAESVFLEVRQSNQGAISLYEKTGFQRIGQRKNYYATDVAGQREDAWVMSLALV